MAAGKGWYKYKTLTSDQINSKNVQSLENKMFLMVVIAVRSHKKMPGFKLAYPPHNPTPTSTFSKNIYNLSYSKRILIAHLKGIMIGSLNFFMLEWLNSSSWMTIFTGKWCHVPHWVDIRIGPVLLHVHKTCTQLHACYKLCPKCENNSWANVTILFWSHIPNTDNLNKTLFLFPHGFCTMFIFKRNFNSLDIMAVCKCWPF